MTCFRQRLGVRTGVGVLVIALSGLGGCFTEEAPSEAGDPGVARRESPMLDFGGIDGLAIGDTTSDAEDEGLRLIEDGDPMNSCSVMVARSLPGVRAVVVDDTIRVLELEGQNKTVAGVGPGSTKAEVKAAHQGRSVQERTNRFSFTELAVPHGAEDDPLTLAYVFDEAGERVTRVRAGRTSNLVAYDEGCA